LKPFIRATVAVFAFSFLLTFAAAQAIPGMTPFSGDFNVKTKKGEEIPGKVYFNGSKWRMDMNTRGHQTILLNDINHKISYMIMPEQKMYMEMHTDQAKSRGPKMPDFKSYDPNNPCAIQEDTTCEKAGVETVNGRPAQKWIFKNTKRGDTNTVWIDQKLHFPLRSVSSEGTESNLTNISESSPDSSLFDIPSGYRKLDLGSMMGQVPPGND
jgi:hypothetical protein